MTCLSKTMKRSAKIPEIITIIMVDQDFSTLSYIQPCEMCLMILDIATNFNSHKYQL
jgi:hypothetical protein